MITALFLKVTLHRKRISHSGSIPDLSVHVNVSVKLSHRIVIILLSSFT